MSTPRPLPTPDRALTAQCSLFPLALWPPLVWSPAAVAVAACLAAARVVEGRKWTGGGREGGESPASTRQALGCPSSVVSPVQVRRPVHRVHRGRETSSETQALVNSSPALCDWAPGAIPSCFWPQLPARGWTTRQ